MRPRDANRSDALNKFVFDTSFQRLQKFARLPPAEAADQAKKFRDFELPAIYSPDCFNDTCHVTGEVHFPPQLRGELAGRSGVQIEEIKAATGEQVLTFESGVALIIGPPDRIADAAAMVRARVENVPRRALTLPAGAQPSRVLGPKGETIKGIKSRSGAVVFFDTNTSIVVLTGTEDYVEIAVKEATAPFDEAVSCSQELTLPAGVQPGRVLGPRGETIREIKSRTGAHVIFDNDTRRVVATCTQDQVEVAVTEVAAPFEKAPALSCRQEVALPAGVQPGRVLGPRGETIKGIKIQTGSFVVFDRDAQSGRDWHRQPGQSCRRADQSPHRGVT
ncbi:unnamed protein product [Prorocentrum cordatum]|uniref:K Homology domain-containing protein n=1 Tax=Prorocentrum cordatum TaxID=2364126 RepID=A0ABN9S843_9DINO|nr:unnamed protein product [Polarella glacialis]